MKNILLLIVLVSQMAVAFAQDYAEYPRGPIEELTPGELCQTPDRYRYPEQIGYCERGVSSEQMKEVFEAYRRMGYGLAPNTRSSYKMDHYIPLCAGGSNGNDNLWPQHKKIGVITDDLERIGCEKMSQGKLSQADFVELIKRAKNNLSEAREIRLQVQAL
jgi:hypothetical protein